MFEKAAQTTKPTRAKPSFFRWGTQPHVHTTPPHMRPRRVEPRRSFSATSSRQLAAGARASSAQSREPLAHRCAWHHAPCYVTSFVIGATPLRATRPGHSARRANHKKRHRHEKRRIHQRKHTHPSNSQARKQTHLNLRLLLKVRSTARETIPHQSVGGRSHGSLFRWMTLLTQYMHECSMPLFAFVSVVASFHSHPPALRTPR